MTDLAKMNELTCSVHGEYCPDICATCRHAVNLHITPDGCLQAGCDCRKFVRGDQNQKSSGVIKTPVTVERHDNVVDLRDSDGRIIVAMEPHPGVAERIADALNRIGEVNDFEMKLQQAYIQLAYLWQQNHSCPCGARPNDPAGYPHVPGCATEAAIDAAGG